MNVFETLTINLEKYITKNIKNFSKLSDSWVWESPILCMALCWHCSYYDCVLVLHTDQILENACFWNFGHKFRKIHKKLEKYAFEDFWVMGLAIWTFEGAKRRTTSRYAQRALCELYPYTSIEPLQSQNHRTLHLQAVSFFK